MNTPTLIYLDANVFIELFEKQATEASGLLWRLIGAVGAGTPEFLVSDLTITEIAVHPIRHGQWDTFNLYRRIIEDKPGLWSVMPVSRNVLEMAANIRARLPRMRLPDAIHLATAIIGRCDVVVTNDRTFRETAKQDVMMPIHSFVSFDAVELEALIGSIA